MKNIKKLNLLTVRFLFLFAILVTGLTLSSCSKGGDQNNEQQNYIPEPAAGTTATPAGDTASGQNAASDSAAQTEQNTPATEGQAGDTKADSAAAAAGYNGQAQPTDSTESNATQQPVSLNTSAPSDTQGTAATAGGNAADVSSSGTQNATTEDTATAATATDKAAEASGAAQTSEAQAPVSVVATSKSLTPAFGSCDSLYQFIDQCVEFKCSVASSMLGQTIDDTFEVKGNRNDKCRFISGIYMKKADNSVIENASLICNFNEQQLKVISAYLKNTDNLKNATITGINDDGKSNSDNPFVTFMATNVCMKACKKNQTETELIELDSKGHFKTRKVRCPAED